jgi:hypothetical protein
VADGVANGLRPWFTKFSGVLHDRRWLRPVADLYRRYAAWEKYLRNERPLARVGLVYSQQTAWFHGANEGHTLGWYQALVEARVPFEMVHDRLLDDEHLAALKTLILPNVVALSDGQCRQLVRFVQRGGGLVATHETSLCDEWGARRKDLGLGPLFGATWKGRVEGPMHNSYLRLEADPATGRRHPLLAGLEDASRVINGVHRVVVEAVRPLAGPPLTLIPSYPDLPMEKVYPRVPRTDVPQVFLREPGRGRVVYFPWDVDRTFWEVLSVDHFKLLRNAVLWATNEEAPATVAGPGVLDVTVWQQKDSLTVHLVNLTNPMMLKGPVRELLPVGEQKVRLRLPDGKQARTVRLLAAGKVVHAEQSGRDVTVTVPSVLDHEVVAVDV